MKDKLKLATVWLDGCSGCHMSFLDVDEYLVTLLEYVDIIHSPIMDIKTFPEWADITMVEGAVSSEEDLHKILNIRAHTGFLIALGDCATNGNIPAMRNRFAARQVLERVYEQNASLPALPHIQVPPLLDRVHPLHEYVKVDFHLPGCPPDASLIRYVFEELLAGRTPDLRHRAHFG